MSLYLYINSQLHYYLVPTNQGNLMWPLNFLVSLIIFLATTLFLRRRNSQRRLHCHRLPPGPPGWPIFGNMFDLGSAMPHRTLADLKEKYGDVIWLRFGAVNTIVVLSAQAATEFFKNVDLSFANRNITETMRVHDYYQGSLALAPYGAFWRVLRRIITVEMLVNKRLNETAPIRRKCVDQMLTWIEEEARRKGERGLHIGRFVFLTSFNMVGNLMLSRDLVDPESEEGAEFFRSMTKMMQVSGIPNAADFFPWLRWLDPQGLRRRMKRDLGMALGIASKFVKERIEEEKKRQMGDDEIRKKDFLDVLLEFEGNGKDEPEKISDHNLNIFILVSTINLYKRVHQNSEFYT